MTSVFAFWESSTPARHWQETIRAKLHQLNRLLQAYYGPASLSWILRAESLEHLFFGS